MKYSIALIQAIAFLDLLAVGLIVPLVPSHVRKMGADLIYVGLLGSIYAGFQLGSGPFIGSLSDIKGRKTVLILTLLVCALAYTTLGVTNSVMVVLIIRAVLGLFKQTQMLTKALVPDYESNERNQSDIYGKMAAISGAGITLGPVIGGHIVEDNPENGFTYIAVIVGILFFVNAVLVCFLPKIKKTTCKKPTKKNNENLWHLLSSSIKQSFTQLCEVEWSIYWDVFLFKALIAFAMGVHYSNYSLYCKTLFNLSPKYIGYVISFQGVVGSISSFFMGYINSFYRHDPDYSLRNFHVFVLLTISLIGSLLSLNVYIYVVWLIPLAVGNAVGRLITLEMVLKRSQGEHRGTLIGASNSVKSLTGVVSPMVSGFIGQYIGITYVIYASICSSFLGFILSYHYRNMRLKVD